MPRPLIALLTDFGLRDPYVGVMKGVIAGRCPDASLIDISHEVSPQNIRQGAYLLWSAYRYFPAWTVFLAVVDPGVGTARQPVAIQTNHGVYVGPDNGLFSTVLDEVEIIGSVVLNVPDSTSNTFHGRDVFAPAAADLACGSEFNAIGTPITDLMHIDVFRCTALNSGVLEGDVIDIDRFGNIITSIGLLRWRDDGSLMLGTDDQVIFESASAHVRIGAKQIDSIQPTYGAAAHGDVMALVNSVNLLEIAINQGNAAQAIQAQVGDTVQLHYRKAN